LDKENIIESIATLEKAAQFTHKDDDGEYTNIIDQLVYSEDTNIKKYLNNILFLRLELLDGVQGDREV